MSIRSLIMLLILLAAGDISHAADDVPDNLEQFRPHWKAGDRWIVETQQIQQQMSVEQKPATARWEFRVQRQTLLQGKLAWQIDVSPTDAPHPRSTLWIEQKTGVMRRITTELPTREGFRSVTECYQHNNTAAPVLGPLPALPVGLPLFPRRGIKSLGNYTYNVISGHEETKALGEVGFSVSIKQNFSRPGQDLLQRLQREQPAIKSAEAQSLLEVKLTTADGSTRQIWSQRQPWPLLSDNGVTRARLVAVTRGEEKALQPSNKETDKATESQDDADKHFKRIDSTPNGESAEADFKPWSGFWWPMRDGLLLKPLEKYDRLTGHRAAEWERDHHPPGPNVPYWHGYCHAWASAAILDAEPVTHQVHYRNGARIYLGVADQKGLLTASHTQDLSNSWGDRYGDVRGTEDRLDLEPVMLWRLLKMHLGQKGVPLIIDVEAGEEVWNFPVYQYRLTHRPTSDGRRIAELALTMADDGVVPSYIGTKPRKQTYQFTFRMVDGNVVADSGRWVGRSAEDHPDFAWYPFKTAASNPEVKYSKVQYLIAGHTPEPVAAETEEHSTAESQPELESEASSLVVSEHQPNDPPDSQPEATTFEPEESPPSTSPLEEEPAASPTAVVSVSAPEPQPVVLSPIELVALITDRTSSFQFDATLDRFEGATYRAGDSYGVNVRSEQPGYLYLLQVDASGAPTLLYPSAGEDNRIDGGKLIEVTPAGGAGTFPVIGPAGIVRIKAVVASHPLVLSGVEQPVQRQSLQANEAEKLGSKAAPISQRLSAHPRRFRLHPSQRRQVQDFLSRREAEVPSSEQLQCPNPQEVLGSFAQDVTMYYVENAVAE